VEGPARRDPSNPHHSVIDRVLIPQKILEDEAYAVPGQWDATALIIRWGLFR